MRLHKQRGAALILVLLVVATIALLSFSMMERLSRDSRRTSLRLNHLQAGLYAQGGLAWAYTCLGKQGPLNCSTQALQEGYQIMSKVYAIQDFYKTDSPEKEAWALPYRRLLNKINPELQKAEGDYFLLETRVKKDQQELDLYALVQRSIGDSKMALTTLWQRKASL